MSRDSVDAGGGPLRTPADGLLLCLLVLMAYGAVLSAGWIWDDDAYVTANPTLRSSEGLERIWLERSATPQYYPLVHTTFWLEWRLWGDGRQPPEAFGFHLDNVLLHALAALLLWRLLARLELRGAWFAAAVFALHPVMVESVAWITERKNVLSLVLALAAAHAYLRWVARARVGWLAAAAVLFVGALLAKSVVASLPAVLLLLLWWKRAELRPAIVVPLLVLLALGAVVGWLTALDERRHVGATGLYWDDSLLERVLIAGRALWFYAAKLALPLRLSFIYPRWTIDAGAAWAYLFPVTALVLIVTLWLQRRRWGRGPLVAVSIFCGVLFPALGFLNVFPHLYSYVADHFQYHAAIALLALLTSGLSALGPFALAPSRATLGPLAGYHPRKALVCWAVVLALLGTLTWRQCAIYRDEETLWRSVLQVNPTAFLAHNNLGTMEYTRGNLDRAAECFALALEHAPDYVLALNNLGNVRLKQGRVAEAEQLLIRAVTLMPDYVKAHVNLGHVYRDRRDDTRAIEHYERANALNEAGPIPRVSLRLAEIYERQGRITEAIERYRLALGGRGTTTPAAVALIWIHSSHPDPSHRSAARALELSERLRATDRWDDPRVLDAAAAAHAEAGRYVEAVQLARRALELAADEGQAAGIQRRLAAYDSGRPWRGPPAAAR